MLISSIFHGCSYDSHSHHSSLAFPEVQSPTSDLFVKYGAARLVQKITGPICKLPPRPPLLSPLANHLLLSMLKISFLAHPALKPSEGLWHRDCNVELG